MVFSYTKAQYKILLFLLCIISFVFCATFIFETAFFVCMFVALSFFVHYAYLFCSQCLLFWQLSFDKSHMNLLICALFNFFMVFKFLGDNDSLADSGLFCTPCIFYSPTILNYFNKCFLPSHSVSFFIFPCNFLPIHLNINKLKQIFKTFKIMQSMAKVWILL